MLTSYAMNQLAAYLAGQVASVDYTVGGKVYQAKPRRVLVSGNTVRVHLYLTDKDPVGTVTRARLLDASGNVLAERTDPQQHEAGKGLLLEFRFTIQAS